MNYTMKPLDIDASSILKWTEKTLASIEKFQ